MVRVMSRVLRNAQLVDGQRVNIEITDGLISGVHDTDIRTSDGQIDDLAGWLVLPALAEPHAHLDKTLTADAARDDCDEILSHRTPYTN